jgi:two-component system LytT family sensor kinase
LGLRITRARLEQLYGTRHSFTIQNLSTGGVDIHIRIPFRTAVLEEVGAHA